MRRYDELVEVRVQPLGPVAFLWRQRLYVVRRVLDCWRERDAWWERQQRAADTREQRIWRVEAGRGRLAGLGVYDLAESVSLAVAESVPPRTGGDPTGPGEGWRLLRAVD